MVRLGDTLLLIHKLIFIISPHSFNSFLIYNSNGQKKKKSVHKVMASAYSQQPGSSIYIESADIL